MPFGYQKPGICLLDSDLVTSISVSITVRTPTNSLIYRITAWQYSNFCVVLTLPCAALKADRISGRYLVKDLPATEAKIQRAFVLTGVAVKYGKTTGD